MKKFVTIRCVATEVPMTAGMPNSRASTALPEFTFTRRTLQARELPAKVAARVKPGGSQKKAL